MYHNIYFNANNSNKGGGKVKTISNFRGEGVLKSNIFFRSYRNARLMLSFCFNAKILHKIIIDKHMKTLVFSDYHNMLGMRPLPKIDWLDLDSIDKIGKGSCSHLLVLMRGKWTNGKTPPAFIYTPLIRKEGALNIPLFRPVPVNEGVGELLTKHLSNIWLDLWQTYLIKL